MKVLDKNSILFLEKYLNNPSPTGYESEGQKIWMEYIKPYVDNFITDVYGTAVGVINPNENYKVVIEGFEGCYLNKNEKGDLVLNKKYEKSPLVQKHIKNKSKSIKLDQVDLRNSENLDILNELSFIEELELYGLKKVMSDSDICIFFVIKETALSALLAANLFS